MTLFSSEEKEAIRNLLANAGSIQEVEEIENAVRKGVLPDQLINRQQQQQQPPPPPPEPALPQKRTNHDTASNEDANDNNQDTTESANKRLKVT